MRRESIVETSFFVPSSEAGIGIDNDRILGSGRGDGETEPVLREFMQDSRGGERKDREGGRLLKDSGRTGLSERLPGLVSADAKLKHLKLGVGSRPLFVSSRKAVRSQGGWWRHRSKGSSTE